MGMSERSASKHNENDRDRTLVWFKKRKKPKKCRLSTRCICETEAVKMRQLELRIYRGEKKRRDKQ
jgi:hypothetical protein